MGSVSEQGLSNIADAIQYAHQVVAGRIPACKWHKACCQRQIDDLAAWESDPEYPFDWRPNLADHEITFLQCLRHVKGKWAGELIKLEPWQKFIEACIFGWVRKSDGRRRYRTSYEEIPRKNAKTTKLAARGLYLLVADNEWGAEVYSAATSRDQAKIVFAIAQQMARIDGSFRARFGVEVLAHSMLVRESGSAFMPLSAEGGSLDGFNVSAALVDELHAHKTRTVYDALDTGTGSRAQPLINLITTAGSNRAGVCYDVRTYGCKILNTVLKRHGGMGYPVQGNCAEDDSFFIFIATLDEGDDPLDEANWPKSNPNFNVSVDAEDMRRLATKAKSSAAALGQFLTKRHNIWVNADTAWMNMLRWDACANLDLKIEDFAGQPCVIGLDAAFKKDLFAKVRLFERGGCWFAFGRYYMNEVVVRSEGNDHLAGWERDGWICTTPGEVLDIEMVRDELIGDPDKPDDKIGDTQRFEVSDVAYDPAQITQFATELLNDHGVPMVEIRPTVLNFSAAMKELEERIIGGPSKFQHNGDPVLAWAIANVVCHRDHKDNIYPNKDKPDLKIDPVIALLMAIGRLMTRQDATVPGIVVL
jgi:phage terminase large subunit-like protein